MARLQNPLYADEATGTLARAIAYRRTAIWPQAAKLPGSSCPPSPAQSTQRARYADALTAWRALDDTLRLFYAENKPANLTGLNFFIRLYMLPTLAYLGYCIFSTAYFQLAPGPNQPEEADYDRHFPAGPDDYPVMHDGSDSPQAWLFNRIYDAIVSIQEYLALHKTSIEGD